MAAPDLPAVSRLHRRRCDETEFHAAEPGPLALLPVARSPSRSCHHGRWWALTPPVRPLPAPVSAGGNAFCCGCSQGAALAGLPPLAVSWGDLVPCSKARDRESGSSSRRSTAVASESPPSNGSPICPRGIIPRYWERIKYAGSGGKRLPAMEQCQTSLQIQTGQSIPI
jgi:hypothetical protein